MASMASSSNDLGPLQASGSAALEAFRKTIRSFALFHFAFAALLLLELIGFLYLVNTYPKTLALALLLSLIFLTIFSYLVLYYYIQTKKPQELYKIKETFTLQMKEGLNAAGSDLHLLLAHSVYQLSSHLNREEYQTYKTQIPSPSLRALLKQLSFFCHWKDVHLMKELLLLDAIDEHVKLIKKEPTNLEAHASLANAYIALSRLYREPKEHASPEELRWKKRFFRSEKMRGKFEKMALRAIEELKILDDYSPNVPWTHLQLASCYSDLNRLDEEIAAYEKTHELSPQDSDVLYRLGRLYFQKGQSSKALRIYEKLKGLDQDKALDLISHYAQ